MIYVLWYMIYIISYVHRSPILWLLRSLLSYLFNLIVWLILFGIIRRSSNCQHDSSIEWRVVRGDLRSKVGRKPDPTKPDGIRAWLHDPSVCGRNEFIIEVPNNTRSTTWSRSVGWQVLLWSTSYQSFAFRPNSYPNTRHPSTWPPTWTPDPSTWHLTLRHLTLPTPTPSAVSVIYIHLFWHHFFSRRLRRGVQLQMPASQSVISWRTSTAIRLRVCNTSMSSKWSYSRASTDRSPSSSSPWSSRPSSWSIRSRPARFSGGSHPNDGKIQTIRSDTARWIYSTTSWVWRSRPSCLRVAGRRCRPEARTAARGLRRSNRCSSILSAYPIHRAAWLPRVVRCCSPAARVASTILPDRVLYSCSPGGGERVAHSLHSSSSIPPPPIQSQKLSSRPWPNFIPRCPLRASSMTSRSSTRPAGRSYWTI